MGATTTDFGAFARLATELAEAQPQISATPAPAFKTGFNA